MEGPAQGTSLQLINALHVIIHRVIVAKAIALGYEKKPEQLPLAQYFHEKFEKGVREGRNYAYRARAGTVKYVKPVSF